MLERREPAEDEDAPGGRACAHCARCAREGIDARACPWSSDAAEIDAIATDDVPRHLAVVLASAERRAREAECDDEDGSDDDGEGVAPGWERLSARLVTLFPALTTHWSREGEDGVERLAELLEEIGPGAHLGDRAALGERVTTLRWRPEWIGEIHDVLAARWVLE